MFRLRLAQRAGLPIKSHWDGDELVCRWRPPPDHVGHPGIVYGGTIASIVDCHSIWTAMATYCRDNGIELDARAPAYVTGKLSSNYLKPARIKETVAMRARVIDAGERRSTIRCHVTQGDIECATAEVIAVRVRQE